MKKGIVMELHRKYTIIMTKEGSFQKAMLIRNAVIGAEVTYKQLEANKRLSFLFNSRRKMSNPVRLIAMACIILLFMLPFYFTMGEGKTYAYVNVDINPSIELEIDESLHVKNIRPLNGDATRIIDGLANYRNEKLAIVIDKIMDESEETGLINKGKNMLVGVSYVAEKNIKNFKVLDNLKRYFSNKNSSWQIAAFKVPKKIRDKAKNDNKSMNEVMATTLVGTDDVSDRDAMDDKDKAIINSFYNTENNTEKNNENNDKKGQQSQIMDQKDDSKQKEKTISPVKKNEQGKSYHKDKKHKENKHDNRHKNHGNNKEGTDNTAKQQGHDKGKKHHENNGKHKGQFKGQKNHHNNNGKHKRKDNKVKHHEDNGKHIGKSNKGKKQYKNNNGKYRDHDKSHKKTKHREHRKNNHKHNGNH